MKSHRTIKHFSQLCLVLILASNLQLFAKEKNTVESANKNYSLGMKKIKQGDVDGAIDALLQAIYFSRNNYYPSAWYWLGMCYKNKKEDTKAINAFKKSIEQTMGGSSLTHLQLGYIYMRNDQNNEALSELDKAMNECSGQAPEISNALGLLSFKTGRYGDACEHFRNALGQPPWTYTEAWMNMAESYIKMKEWITAYTQYQNILSSPQLRDVDLQKVYLNMGICLLTKGNHEGAINYWRECIATRPLKGKEHAITVAEAHLNLGSVFDQEKHITSAITEYKAFIGLAPADDRRVPQVENRLSFLEQQLKKSQPEPESTKPLPTIRTNQPQGESGF